ncbi:hypothetical protein HYALB_00007486 [Hymenoscyphus albidus]|uniref:Uncharacterized protein n=1 Tax=Hymenoscyphus albidus TaxID=595503 RepID=A0A9N9LK15_9HELO|nr:hypothetical protein HYALB_00007486 [Hymenoscyphus albidus]
MTKGVIWPLRSLCLYPYHSRARPENVSSESILPACAATLETLFWTAYPEPANPSELTFPRLRELEFLEHGGNHLHLDALLRAPLVVLSLRGANGAIGEILAKRGCISTLRTFVYCDSYAPTEVLLPFLRENSHITHLSLPKNAPDTDWGQILPVLGDSFARLKTLRFGIPESRVPLSALQAISNTTSLEKLCMYGKSTHELLQYTPRWLIDHDAMRTHFCKLRQLRKLYYIDDTYRPIHTDFDPIDESTFDYYDSRWPGIDHITSLQIEELSYCDILWERQHYERMEEQANLYGEVMPQLKFLYIGHYSMVSKRVGDEMVFDAKIRHREKISEDALLGEFGWKGRKQFWG